jgi:hypothetical protein
MRFFKAVLVVLLLPVALIRGLFPRRSPGINESPRERIPEDQRRPPDARAVASRLLCLAALQERLKIEIDFERNASDTDPRRRLERLLDWMEDEGLRDSLSAIERTLLDRPPGLWREQEAIDVSWRHEAMVAFAWALGVLRALPPYDRQFDEAADPFELPLLLPARGFLERAAMLPAAELAKARDTAEVWMWRARTWSLMNKPGHRANLPDGMTFEQIIALTAEKLGGDGVMEPVDGDFPALGKAYSRLDEAEQSTLASIANERLHAFNWLCGHAVDWDRVPTDT